MNKRQKKAVALVLAFSMMSGGMTCAINNNPEKASAAKKSIRELENNNSDVLSETVTDDKVNTATGPAIDDPNAEIIGISIKQNGDKKVLLNWEEYEETAIYTLFYSEGDSEEYKQSDVEGTQTEMELVRGTKYTFCVVVFSEDGQVLARTNKISVCIPKKNSVRFTRLNNKRVKINWNKAVGADKYIVYKKTNNGKYKILVKTEKLKFIDKKVCAGKKYRYYVKALNVQENGTYSTVSKAKSFIIANFVNTRHQKYSYGEMSRDIKALQNSYSDYVDVKVLGKSNDNRNIYDVVIGNPKAKKTMLVVCNLHAREYMTSQLSMAQIEHYLKNYNGAVKGVKVKSVLNKIAVHYIPMANPDGTTISQFGISKIRNKKLRAALRKMPGASRPSLWKANARGVDLNRNYRYNYRANYGGPRGASGYTGTRAESEPEARAIVKIIKELKSKTIFRGTINYHAMGSIVFGDAVGKTKQITTKMYRLARGLTGYASAAGYGNGKKSVGSLREYTMYKVKIPSITIEIGVGGCPLPTSQFGSIWRRNYSLVIREAKLLS